jgi:hypothetical protein
MTDEDPPSGTPLTDSIEPRSTPRDPSERGVARLARTHGDSAGPREEGEDPLRPTTEDVLARIPEDNPFREAVAALREQGAAWDEVWDALQAAYSPVDAAVLAQRLGKEVYPAGERGSVVAPGDDEPADERDEGRWRAEESDLDLGEL